VVDATLEYFGTLFGRLKIEWCVAGAVAANAYRDPRATTDLDLIVHIPAAQFLVVREALESDAWRLVRVSPDSDYPDVVRLRHDRLFATDLLLTKIGYQAEALRRARSHRPEGPRVLAAEDVIIHKLIAHRHRDLADVEEILKNRPPLDEAYIEHWAEEWGIAERWEEARRAIPPAAG
jgi:hypothetical protein